MSIFERKFVPRREELFPCEGGPGIQTIHDHYEYKVVNRPVATFRDPDFEDFVNSHVRRMAEMAKWREEMLAVMVIAQHPWYLHLLARTPVWSALRRAATLDPSIQTPGGPPCRDSATS